MSQAPRDARSAARLRLIGGRPCLDFVNTLAWRGGARPKDRLDSYGALITWSRRAGALSSREAAALRRRAAEKPALAAATLRRALSLREALHRLFTDPGGPGRDADLATVNSELESAPARRRLGQSAGGFAWARRDPGARLDRMLWPIVWSSADLLAGGALEPARGRITACADKDCGALFLDTSRNRARRWCAMEDCGNRAKARRHYARRARAAGG
jgi:predicted RNA-binding Zn ribbon-like protein